MKINQPLREPTIFPVYAVDYSAIFQIWISISGNLVSRPPDFATKKPKLLTYFNTSQKELSLLPFFALHLYSEIKIWLKMIILTCLRLLILDIVE